MFRCAKPSCDLKARQMADMRAVPPDARGVRRNEANLWCKWLSPHGHSGLETGVDATAGL
jgi:hypothetical protein